MLYNNIDMSDYMRIIDVRGRGLTEQELTTVRVIGSDEDYVTYRTKPPRYLEIDYEIRAKNKEELRKKIDEVSAIIETTEKVPIIFPDELNRTYFGEYAGVEESVEYHHVGIHRGTIYILRDPYKYGPEKTVETTSDTFNIENDGTADADPIIELTATQKATFAMISNGEEEYNLIGTPSDDDIEIVDSKELIYQLSGMSGWQTSGTRIDPISGAITSGTFAYDGTGLIVNNYGSPPAGYNGYGPAIIRELPEVLQDFEIETIIDTRTNDLEQNFRVEIYGFDENMNMLGKIGIQDGSKSLHERIGLARVGEYVNNVTRYLISRNNFYFMRSGPALTFLIKFKRVGKQFEVNIYRIVNGELRNWVRRRYNDTKNEWLGNLKFIQVYIRTYRNRSNPTLARVNKLDVYKLSQATVDQTPYIIYPGDVITFNHKNNDILLNGEPRMDLKNFGGSFFKLKKGINTLAITPENTFNTKIIYRERYK